MADVSGSEQDTVKHGGRVHGARLPAKYLGGTVTAILPALVREVSLHVGVMDKAPVDGKDLLPGARPREPGVGHSSGSSEMSLDEVLPGLPRLDALFPD